MVSVHIKLNENFSVWSGIEGGQNNNDAIYGSHDDHDTFGVAGEGWQGPGNGEDILDLYNPGTWMTRISC